MTNKDLLYSTGFPGGLVEKSQPANARDTGSIPDPGRSPGEGNGNPLQYSCLGIPWTEEPGGLQSMGMKKSRSREWLNENKCMAQGALPGALQWPTREREVCAHRTDPPAVQQELTRASQVAQWQKESAWQCKRLRKHRFNSWVGRIPWRSN